MAPIDDVSEALIRRLIDRIRDPSKATDAPDSRSHRIHRPVTAVELDSVERRVGFTLPGLLRRVYGEVANGGVGQSYGLLGISGGARNEDGLDGIGLYEQKRLPRPADPHWRWPEKLLPLGHLGCAMYCCVDCQSNEMPIVWFEPNPHTRGESWSDSFIPFADSFEQWMDAWLEGNADAMFEIAWARKFGNG